MNYKQFLTGAIVGLAILALYWLFFLRAPVLATDEHENGQIQICHYTQSHWVINTPNKSGNVGGHDGHSHDIIPPFTYWQLINPPGPNNSFWVLLPYLGKNWDAEGQAIYRNECVVPEEPEVTPTPTPEPECDKDECEPTPTPTPEEPKVETGNSPFHQPEAPQCQDGNTNGAVANPHVYRNGSSATVNFFVTDGDKAHVFYKEVNEGGWTHSVANVGVNADKFGSVTINDLDPNKGYTFGIMQVKGCGGGSITAVVVDDPTPTLFNLSYWLFN